MMLTEPLTPKNTKGRNEKSYPSISKRGKSVSIDRDKSPATRVKITVF